MVGVFVLDGDGDCNLRRKVPDKHSVHGDVHDTDRLAGDGEFCEPDGEQGALACVVGSLAFKADSQPADVAGRSRDVVSARLLEGTLGTARADVDVVRGSDAVDPPRCRAFSGWAGRLL